MDAIKIVEYDEFRAKLDEVKDACNFLPDASTDDGYQKSKRVSLDVGKILTAVEKCRKDKKAYALELGRTIDDQAKSIVTELEKYQLPHKEAYKELDNLKKEREAARKAELELRVEEIRTLPEAMRDSDSEGIKMALESLNSDECLDYYEYTQPALKARNASKEALSKMFGEKLKQEQEARELSELRAKQAEQEQKDRDERIAKEAAAEAEEKAASARKSEAAAIEQANEAVRQREALEAKSKADAEEAEKRRSEAALQAELGAEQARQDAIKEEQDRQAAEKLREQQEQEKLERNKKHVGAIRKAAKESFMAMGYPEAEAKKLVLAISNKEIANVTINY